MEMRVIMCSDTPIHAMYSSRELALEKIDKLRALHFVQSGCNQSMTFSTYKETYVWYFVETSWEVETDESLLDVALDKKYTPDNCILHFEEFEIQPSHCSDLDVLCNLEQAIADDILEKERASKELVAPVVQADCPHSWQVGIQKGRHIAQCVHCLKVEVMTGKEMIGKKQTSFVKQTVGGK